MRGVDQLLRPTHVRILGGQKRQDPSPMLRPGVLEGDGSLCEAAWQALSQGGDFRLPKGALKASESMTQMLLDKGILVETPSETIHFSHHADLVYMAARHGANQGELRSEFLQMWLDGGFEGYLEYLIELLCEAERHADAIFIVRWLLAGEAPLETDLMMSKLQALRCLGTLLKVAPEQVDQSLWQPVLKRIFAQWRPMTPMALWSAILFGLAELLHVKHESGRAASGVLMALFRGQLEALVSQGPGFESRLFLCQEILGAFLSDEDEQASDLLLTQYADMQFRARALVQAQLRFVVRSPRVASLLDEYQGQLTSTLNQVRWLEARFLAGQDEDLLGHLGVALQSEHDEIRWMAAQLLPHLEIPLDPIAYVIAEGIFDDHPGVALNCARALKDEARLSDTQAERYAEARAKSPLPLPLLWVESIFNPQSGDFAPRFDDYVQLLEDDEVPWERCERMRQLLVEACLDDAALREGLLPHLSDEKNAFAALMILESLAKILFWDEVENPWKAAQSKIWRKAVVDGALGQMENWDGEMQTLAMTVCGYLGKHLGLRTSGRLLRAMGAADSQALIHLLPALGAAQIPGEGALQYLEEGICHEDLAVVQGACEGLITFSATRQPGFNIFEERPELIERLVGWTQVADRGVAKAALEALFALARRRVH